MKKLISLSLLLFAATACAATETYAYDAAGRLTAVDYGNGVTVRLTYDNAGNMLSRTIDNSGAGSPAQQNAGTAANRDEKAQAAAPRSKKQTSHHHFRSRDVTTNPGSR